MIYAYTRDHHAFQSFMQDFHLRQDFPGEGCTVGSECIRGQCRRGQVVHLYNPEQQLRGMDSHNIVLAWGNWRDQPDADFVQDYCAARDIPFIGVPDLMRQRYMREQAVRYMPPLLHGVSPLTFTSDGILPKRGRPYEPTGLGDLQKPWRKA